MTAEVFESLGMASEIKIPISVLDLVPVIEGGTLDESFKNSVELARLAERLGYNRYWLAEHHNMPGIASAATSVVIGHIAAATKSIRVGAGGIMLPNHAPIVIAEQFGTLESLFPGRIDLGIGRAPGSDRLTAHALRRALQGDDLPELLRELQFFFAEPEPGQRVQAVPGAGLDIPIWLLGSSDFSARLAGRLGLPFAFAAHFSPEGTLPALAIYRSEFRPSEKLEKPYAMVAVSVIAADTTKQAEYLATSQFQSFLNVIKNDPGRIQPPVDDMDKLWSPVEKQMVMSRLSASVIGDKARVREGLSALIYRTAADEIMVSAIIYDHKARLRSHEIVAEVRAEASTTAAR